VPIWSNTGFANSGNSNTGLWDSGNVNTGAGSTGSHGGSSGFGTRSRGDSGFFNSGNYNAGMGNRASSTRETCLTGVRPETLCRQAPLTLRTGSRLQRLKDGAGCWAVLP
jgi:hypothetical protein